jgi:O-antigen/teichoic acid export membrane protein
VTESATQIPAPLDLASVPGQQQRRKGSLEAVVRGGTLNLVGAVVNAAMSVALVIVIARGFSRSTAGSFWSVLSLFLVLQQAGKFGVDTGIVYFLPRQRVQHRIADLRATIRMSLLAVLVAGILTGLALFLLAPLVAETVLGPNSDGGVTLIRVLALGMPISMIYDIVLAGTRGFGAMAPGVFLDKIGRSFLQPLLVLLLLALDVRSVAALAIAWLIPYGPTMPIAVAWLRRLVRRAAGEARAARAEALNVPAGASRSETLHVLAGSRNSAQAVSPGLRQQFWSYTRPRALASAFQIALTRIDVVLISALRGPADAAVYVAVTRLLVLGQFAVQAVQAAMSPQISSLLAADDRTAVEQLYQLSTAWLVMLSWPIYLLFASYGPPVLSILGKSYAHGGDDVVTLLAVGMLFAAASGPVDVLLLMAGQSRRSLFNRFIALVVNVGVDLVLIPRMGILGAAIGWAIALIAANVLGLFQVRGVLGFSPFGPATRVAAVLAIIFFGVFPLAVRLATGTSLAGFAAALVLGTVGYGFCIHHWRQLLRLRLLRSLRRRPARRPAAEVLLQV